MLSILDFSMPNADWQALLRDVSPDLAGAAKKIAKFLVSNTKSPLDDLALPYIEAAVQEWLTTKLIPIPVTMASPPELDGPVEVSASANDAKRQRIIDLAKAKGVTLSPMLLMLLLQFAWPIIERVLNRE